MIRQWNKQCSFVEMVDVCVNFCVPGQEFCMNHGGARTQEESRVRGASSPSEGRPFPKIVTLIGSTRFHETFRDVGLDLTVSGVIVLSIGTTHGSDAMVLAHPEKLDDKAKEIKTRLDWLHKRKIDISDEVLVLNVDGYIGDSSRSEIAHAEKCGVPVKWLYPLARNKHAFKREQYGERCVCLLPEGSLVHESTTPLSDADLIRSTGSFNQARPK